MKDMDRGEEEEGGKEDTCVVCGRACVDDRKTNGSRQVYEMI
jgi:hypothetical protein